MQLHSEITELLNLMSDEESKRLFTLRMAFSLEGDMKYAFSMMRPYFSYGGVRYDHDDELLVRLRSEKDVVVFCTGGQGARVIAMLDSYDIKISCCSDNSSLSWETEFMDLPVISPEKLVKEHPDALIIIASYEHQGVIAKQLLGMGVRESRLCYFDNGDKLQYFDSDIVTFNKGVSETFVDGGCFNFDTSVRFLNCVKDNGVINHVVAFEPDSNNVEKCRNRYELEKTNYSFEADIVAAGLWSKSAELRFACSGTEGTQQNDEGDIIVPVKSVDDVIKEKKVTFLKMDIEGAELEALHGAANTIKRDKPRCAICVYHKPEDIYEITAYLHELVPEYKFYMRHYSLCDYETVLYAKV